MLAYAGPPLGVMDFVIRITQPESSGRWCLCVERDPKILVLHNPNHHHGIHPRSGDFATAMHGVFFQGCGHVGCDRIGLFSIFGCVSSDTAPAGQVSGP